MKPIICFILCFGTLLGNPIDVSAKEINITPYLNNAMSIDTNLVIDSQGTATIVLGYTGTDTSFADAKITTQLQKRFLLVFWTDVDGGYWVDESSESSYTAVHTLSVATGTYRVQVEYLIYGTDGSVETVNDEAQYTYK